MPSGAANGAGMQADAVHRERETPAARDETHDFADGEYQSAQSGPNDFIGEYHGDMANGRVTGD